MTLAKAYLVKKFDVPYHCTREVDFVLRFDFPEDAEPDYLDQVVEEAKEVATGKKMSVVAITVEPESALWYNWNTKQATHRMFIVVAFANLPPS